MVDSGSFTLCVVLNAANITDSHLKGEKAATKPAFWMKMTLILSTAQVLLLIHLEPVLLCGCMLRAELDGGGGALRSDTISGSDVLGIAMVVLLPLRLFFLLRLRVSFLLFLLFLSLSST